MKPIKHILVLLACVACWNPGWAGDATAQAREPAAVRAGLAQAAQVRQFTLPNGMQLIVKPDRRAPTAMHMLVVRVGSMDEVDGTSGVAHALEHMMFKGSAQLAPGEFSRRMAALGAWENAFTSRDYTAYHQQIPASRLPEAMQMEAERFAHNQWPDEEFTREIEVIKEERRMRVDDNPRAVLFEQLYAASFMAAPYRRPVIGWMGDIESMTAGDVRAFYRQWYVPQNAAVVVLGDVDVAQVHAWARQYYGGIARRPLPPRKPRAEPAQAGTRRIQVQRSAEQAFVALAFHAPTLASTDDWQDSDRDALALLVLSAVLDGYKGARLERALVQGQDGAARVADQAGSSAQVFGRGPGLFLLTGVPAAGKSSADVEAALRAEVAKIARDGVDAAELERVKVQWRANNIYERDSITAQANTLAHYWALGLPLDSDERVLAQLRGISSADVQRVAARYFGDERLNAAVLVPQPLPEGSKARKPRPDFGGVGAPGGRLH